MLACPVLPSRQTIALHLGHHADLALGCAGSHLHASPLPAAPTAKKGGPRPHHSGDLLAPRLRLRPPDPRASPAQGVQERLGGRRNRGVPTILPVAPCFLPAQPPAQKPRPPPAVLQPLGPSPRSPDSGRGGAQGRSAGESWGRRGQAQPTELQIPVCPNSPGSKPDPGPAPSFRQRSSPQWGWREASPAPLPAAPNSDVHCATQGPRYRVPALSYKSQGASRHPGADGTPAHPLKGAATPPGSVCGDGVRERGSGCFLRHRTHPVSVPAPRAVPSPAKGCGIAAYLSSLGLPAPESRTQDARRSEYPGERCAGFGLEALSLRSCPKFDPWGSWASSLESSLPGASFWAGCTPPRGLPFSPLRHGPFGS